MVSDSKIQIVRDYVNKLHATYILHYGVELGLFDAINKIGKTFTVETLANKLGYYPPFVSRWCFAAYAIDVLDYVNNETFSISDEWLDLFLNEESCSYAPYLPKCHIKIAEYLSWVPDSIKTGKTYNFDSTDDEFIEAVEKDGIRFTNCLIKEIIPRLPEFEKILNDGATLLNKPEYEMAALVDWFEMTWGTAVPTRNELNEMLMRNNFTTLEEVPVVDAVIAGISRKISS